MNCIKFKPNLSQLPDYIPIISSLAAIRHFVVSKKENVNDNWGPNKRGRFALIPVIGNIILLIHDIQKSQSSPTNNLKTRRFRFYKKENKTNAQAKNPNNIEANDQEKEAEQVLHEEKKPIPVTKQKEVATKIENKLKGKAKKNEIPEPVVIANKEIKNEKVEIKSEQKIDNNKELKPQEEKKDDSSKQQQNTEKKEELKPPIVQKNDETNIQKTEKKNEEDKSKIVIEKEILKDVVPETKNALSKDANLKDEPPKKTKENEELKKQKELEEKQKSEKLKRFNEIISKAQNIIEELKQAALKQAAHPEKLNFEVLQILKKVKKEAKNLYQAQELNSELKKPLEQVIDQYHKIVEGNEVLSLLKRMSQEIRKPENGRPVIENFKGFFVDVDLDQNDKETLKKKWIETQQKIWDGFFEAQEFLNQNKKITFITGRTSSSLISTLRIPEFAPKLSDKPALVSEEKLAAYNFTSIIKEFTFDKTYLCGMVFSNLNECVQDIFKKKSQFNADENLNFINDLQADEMGEHSYYQLRLAVLRLLLMGAKKEEYENIKRKITALRDSTPNYPPPLPWKKLVSLIGDVCDLEGSVPKIGLQRGQIVVIPRSKSNPTYGIIAETYEDGTYKVIVDIKRASKKVASSDLKIVDDQVLLKEAKLKEPLKDFEIVLLEKELKSERELLQDTLNLFNTIKPLNLSAEELDLIQNPFPIIWSSHSLNPQVMNQGFKDEWGILGDAILGKDIQLAFTNRENVKKLQSLVKDFGVRVLSFEAAHFILGYKKEKNENFEPNFIEKQSVEKKEDEKEVKKDDIPSQIEKVDEVVQNKLPEFKKTDSDLLSQLLDSDIFTYKKKPFMDD